MLASFTTKRWYASKHDERVTAKVAKDHGADEAMGHYTKRLIAKEALLAIRECQHKARHHHYHNTLPWKDTGARILPAKSYFDYAAKMDEYRHQFETAVAKFVKNYPSYVKAAKKSLGTLYEPDDYPSPDAIAALFTMGTVIEKIPSGEDFRVDVGAEAQAEIRAQIEAEVGKAVEDAMRDVWRRLHDAVAKMSKSLKEYGTADDGRSAPLRDHVVENMRELASEVLPKLNITGSNSLEAARAKLEAELCAYDGETLRKDPKLRETVAKRADAILADVDEWLK
jgi:hypothetical protein